MSTWIFGKKGSAVTSPASHSTHQNVPFNAAFKAVFGFAVAALVIVGSVLYILNSVSRLQVEFNLFAQALTAVLGGVLGAVSVWRARGTSPER